MVLKVLADGRKVDFSFDALRGKLVRRADAREHHQLRCVDDTARKKNLGARIEGALGTVMIYHNTGGAFVLQDNLLGRCLCQHREIGTLERGAQIGGRR